MDIGGSAVNFGGVLTSGVKMVEYGLLILLIAAVLTVAYFWLTYKYKVTVFVRRGNGDGDFGVGNVKNERGRIIKSKGVSKLKLLFSRKEIPTPDYKDIYPNNKIFLYKSGDSQFIPVGFNAGNPSAVFKPLPFDIKFLEQLEIRQANEDYANDDWKTKYAPLIMTLGTVLFCCIFAGVVIYFSYKLSGDATAASKETVSAFQNAANSFANMNNIGGIAPN